MFLCLIGFFVWQAGCWTPAECGKGLTIGSAGKLSGGEGEAQQSGEIAGLFNEEMEIFEPARILPVSRSSREGDFLGRAFGSGLVCDLCAPSVESQSRNPALLLSFRLP